MKEQAGALPLPVARVAASPLVVPADAMASGPLLAVLAGDPALEMEGD